MTRCRLALVVLLWTPLLGTEGVTVTGTVRDSHHKPVAGAAVTLELSGSKDKVTAKTDAQGFYRVTVPAGTYSLRAESQAGRGTAGPVTVPLKQGAGVDIVIEPNTTAEMPFFDEPQFTVAGVKDNTYRGGHGSDAVLRSAEALTRETAALSKASAPDDPRRALAEINEGEGRVVEAAHEYQRAAELNPSEPNLYDWGAELLTHRAPEAAAEVFTKGVRLFPQSVRMMLGLASAWYSAGAYEKAGGWFYRAVDVDPGTPEPYLFLGKVQAKEITESAEYAERMARFAKLHPEDGRALYYYAVSLWSRRSGAEDAAVSSEVRALLEKAIAVDPKFGAAHLQLGIIDAAERKYTDAIAEYRQAVEVSPELEEAHYRLAAAYRLTGERVMAEAEMAIYKRQSQESAESIERERNAIQQFVIDLKTPKH